MCSWRWRELRSLGFLTLYTLNLIPGQDGPDILIVGLAPLTGANLLRGAPLLLKKRGAPLLIDLERQ